MSELEPHPGTLKGGTDAIRGTLRYVCGWCGLTVATSAGAAVVDGNYKSLGMAAALCPACNRFTVVQGSGPEQKTHPAFPAGRHVAEVPEPTRSLYEEARRALSGGAPTACVLACRKMLMNIAVDRGARAGRSFADYVKYLGDNGLVPPDGRPWVDHIRKRGNEATHKISLMHHDDATELLDFTEMLLRFIYEFPSILARHQAPADPTLPAEDADSGDP